MVKHLNKDAITIKELLNKGMRQCQIAKLLNLKRAKVNYWSKVEIKERQFKKKKLKDEYIKKIQKWATNKTTSLRSSRKISYMINSVLEKKGEVDKKGKKLSIHFTTVNNYLKEYFGRPKKIRKVFYLSDIQKKKRCDFCQKILAKKLKPEQIFFTDESKVELGPFTHDYIRLDPNLNRLDKKTYDLLNRPTKKFEKSITIAGGINYYGVSKLIFLEGTMTEFSYGQALLFYKDDIDKIEKKINSKLIFEQDGASSHTSKSNIFLLDKLFTPEGWIQNPPNSPDLAYPIERLWGIIKPRVKRREPKSLEELKHFLLEEWNSIPIELIQNLCKGYLSKIKKCFELGGERLEPEYFKKENKMPHNWEENNLELNQRIIYNYKALKKCQKQEIKTLKREIKETEKKYIEKIKQKRHQIKKLKFKKRDLRNLSIGRALSIINQLDIAIDDKNKTEEEKEEQIKVSKEKVELISKMNVFHYLKHLNGKDEDDDNSESTIEEIEEKMDDLEELIKKNKDIKYNIKY